MDSPCELDPFYFKIARLGAILDGETINLNLHFFLPAKYGIELGQPPSIHIIRSRRT